MENNRAFISSCLMIIALFLLSACNPDCENEVIQKVEWITRYEDYYSQKDTLEEVSGYIDTLVSYVISDHSIRAKYIKTPNGEIKKSSLSHYITVYNNNESYSNRFAIICRGKEFFESSNNYRNINRTTDYVTINPKCSHTFVITHSSWWRNEERCYNETDVSFSVAQEPVKVFVTKKQIKKIRKKNTRRIDSLVLSDTVVNSCECNIEALTHEYKTIWEIFQHLKDGHVIYVD